MSPAMWRAAVTLMCLLVALVSSAQATEGHPIYGVKLCGREFIRAVIFTCGGSRWKRSVDMPGDQADDPFSAHDSEASKGWSTNSIPGLPYKLRSEAEAPDWAEEGQEAGSFIRQARSLMLEEVLEALRTSDRKGRDVVVGLSNACCKWGCSKSEISSLC